MSGYAIVHGQCYLCKQLFAFHPHRVPSFPVNGQREPVCEPCMVHVNKLRAEKGVPVFRIDPAAYEPCPEEEL